MEADVCTYVRIILCMLCAIFGHVTNTTNLDIECHGGILDTKLTRMDGYELDNVRAPVVKNLTLNMVFPARWKLARCCHRVQLELDLDDLRRDEDNFPLFVKWTMCPDLTHWKCFGRFNYSRDNNESVTMSESGSWFLTLEHCLEPTNKTSQYELRINYIPNHQNISSDLAPTGESGQLFIKPLYGRRKLQKSVIPNQTFCVLKSDFVRVDNHQKVLYHNLSLTKSTSLYFKITFSLEVPSNSEIFRVYFIIPEGAGHKPLTEGLEDFSSTTLPFSCDQPHLNKTQPPGTTTPGILSRGGATPGVLSQGPFTPNLGLRIGSVWSGCHIENREGRPTYRCTGGWSFVSDITTSIALATCLDIDITSVFINYTLEFYGPRVNGKECPSTSHGGYQHASSITTHILCALIVFHMRL